VVILTWVGGSLVPTRQLLTVRQVYHVLLHLHKRLPLGNFFRLLEDGGECLAPATRLLQVYAREQNREMLRDFYYSEDRRVESAILLLEEAAGMADQSAKITATKAAQKFFSEDKDRAFEAKVTPQSALSDVTEQLTSVGEMVDENAKLLALQQQLEKDSGGRVNFFGLSVNETIRTCLVNGMSKEADNVKGTFKVPDKRCVILLPEVLPKIFIRCLVFGTLNCMH